ncbi:MAG: 3-dehydroquinate synthase [Candidatus Cloacimonetes bacterium]|nr:3-dehydroquinate synthase [Candidatus Cloacimonadota bacterium]MCK9185579.1 3-dehydroquinate synthase [Candidatus Cloacimonadota bacterium]
MNTEYLRADSIELAAIFQYPASGVILCDARLLKLYPEYFGADKPLPTLALRAGESSKNMGQCLKIYEFLSENGVGRQDIVHVFGGGTISDLAAYAVSTFKRGCRLILYPSTLLAMIDAAIGGKTGLNHLGYKNYLGSFYPAEKIIIHSSFLKSLPKAELRQGFAEMLKYSLLADDLLLPELVSPELGEDDIILSFALYKMQVCAIDPYDRKERLMLNFGHSFGHALEAASQYKIKHGDAIVLGMSIACDFSFQQGLIEEEDWADYRDWLGQYPVPAAAMRFVDETPLEVMKPFLLQDKKNGQSLRLILPTEDGIKVVEATIGKNS